MYVHRLRCGENRLGVDALDDRAYVPQHPNSRAVPPPNGLNEPTRPSDRGISARTADESSTWEHLLCTVLRCPRNRVNSELDSDWQWNRCAIIARYWADLDPARSACMAHGIPVQSAREEFPSFWRAHARETQRFLRTLEAGDATTIETQEIQHHRADLTGDPWAALPAQALEELLPRRAMQRCRQSLTCETGSTSGARKYGAGSRACSLPAPTGQRAWSSITSSFSTEGGGLRGMQRTLKLRAVCTTSR